MNFIRTLLLKANIAQSFLSGEDRGVRTCWGQHMAHAWTLKENLGDGTKLWGADPTFFVVLLVADQRWVGIPAVAKSHITGEV